MRGQLKDIIAPLVITILILLFLEVISSALFPVIGINQYRLPFHILIVLFLGFKIENPYLAIPIFVIQYFHSFFSIEGWEMGTIAGVVICFVISYVRDLIHFSSIGATMIITQIFQVVWLTIVSSVLYLKTENASYIIEKFWRFLPESVIISVIAPFAFVILEKVWNRKEGGLLRNEG